MDAGSNHSNIYNPHSHTSAVDYHLFTSLLYTWFHAMRTCDWQKQAHKHNWKRLTSKHNTFCVNYINLSAWMIMPMRQNQWWVIEKFSWFIVKTSYS